MHNRWKNLSAKRSGIGEKKLESIYEIDNTSKFGKSHGNKSIQQLVGIF
jgi:hypothetical protein